MPNWCENTLYVSGNRQQLKKFVDKAKSVEKTNGNETDLSLNNLYPMPAELEGSVADMTKNEKMIKKYGASNWYDWHIKNWGTKWDVEAEITHQTADEVIYYFSSAWSPPVEWLAKVSKDYPKLHFRLEYEEPGMGFKGETNAERGEIDDNCENMTDEDYGEYND